MKFILIAISLGLMLTSGCALLNAFKENISQEDRVKIIHDTARAGTFAALEQMSNPEEDAADLISFIDDVVMPVLNSSLDIGPSTSVMLLGAIPSDYAIYLAPALSTFNAYYDTPSVGELISEEDRELLMALFQGIKAGAEESL